jgi:hypothetical protein
MAKLQNLGRGARELNSAHLDCNDSSARAIFYNTLRVAQQLGV